MTIRRRTLVMMLPCSDAAAAVKISLQRHRIFIYSPSARWLLLLLDYYFLFVSSFWFFYCASRIITVS